MNEKIRPNHLERKAILYVRQSSVYQVNNNLESQKLQYAMEERLRNLGQAAIRGAVTAGAAAGYTSRVQASPKTPESVRFGIFEVDRRAGELRKRGVKIRLQDQPFQILLMLLERPSEVVTRQEIRARLWPSGTIVEFEHSVGTAIKYYLIQLIWKNGPIPQSCAAAP